MSYAENQITLEVVEDGNEVYVTEPTTPYSAGDLYVDKDETTTAMVTDDDDPLVDDSDNQFEVVEVGESDIYVCTNPRGSGEFNNDDWRLAASTQDKKLREHFWHDDQGAHVLGELSGYRNDITSTGMKIVDTSSETSVAEFGSNGARIGQTDESHLFEDYHSLQLIDKEGNKYLYVSDLRDENGNATYTSIGNGTTTQYRIGYPLSAIVKVTLDGVETSAYSYSNNVVTFQTAPASGVVIAFTFTPADAYKSGMKAYTLGMRASAPLGPMSCVVGDGGTASQPYCFGVGLEPTASGYASYAEGMCTEASGSVSHAQGQYTIAQGAMQTVLGSYNIPQGSYSTATASDYVLIIGNGSADNSRSNALTVDWSGNVVLAGGLTVASPTTSFSGTVGSGLTGSCNGIYDALSKTVRINFQVRKSTDIATSDVLFTIPSAYRPSAAVSGSGVVEAYVSSAYRTRAYEVTLNTSGEIKQGYSSYARSIFGVFEYSL